MKIQKPFVAVALAVAVLVAPAAFAQSAQKDIVDTAVAAGSFKTLATALQAAGLIETLKGKGPFTVFAPTDEAFAKIPKADLDALLKDKDEPIWSAALAARATHLLTGDIKDFGPHMNRPASTAGVVIQTVGDYLAAMR
jgi:hypothetical protein